jgi:hypothetical protein
LSVKIEQRIGVKAPPAVVWEVLSDLPAWSDWNPVYPKAAGVIRYGERLTLTEAFPGQPHREVVLAIADWAPDEALHLRSSAMGGFVQTIRFLEIETLSAEGCVFTAGELFTGLLAPWVARKKRRMLKRAFLALCEAIRDQAEARWRQRSGGAT